jgi:hypothetical protein
LQSATTQRQTVRQISYTDQAKVGVLALQTVTGQYFPYLGLQQNALINSYDKMSGATEI